MIVVGVGSSDVVEALTLAVVDARVREPVEVSVEPVVVPPTLPEPLLLISLVVVIIFDEVVDICVVVFSSKLLRAYVCVLCIVALKVWLLLDGAVVVEDVAVEDVAVEDVNGELVVAEVVSTVVVVVIVTSSVNYINNIIILAFGIMSYDIELLFHSRK